MAYYVYILKSFKDGTYYVGSTQDLKSRIERHNQGRTKYTKPKRRWELVYPEEHPDRSSVLYQLPFRKCRRVGQFRS